MKDPTKDEFIQLLVSCKRDGMQELIKWLVNETDFFTAPASTKYHGNYPGGLCAHSLNVYDSMTVLNDQFSEDKLEDSSMIIAALLHDACKVNYYVEDEDPASSAQINYVNDLLSGRQVTIPKAFLTKKYVSKCIEALKENSDCELPETTKGYKVIDELPMGHGEKSLYLVSRFIDLDADEALAIRWHLGMHDPGTHFQYPSGSPFQQAQRQSNLVRMIIAADYLATWMVDITV